MKKLVVTSVLVLAMSGIAWAQNNPGMMIESKTIDAAPGQEVLVFATGTGAAVRDMNLQLQVGDGGDLLGGTDRPGIEAAPITGVDFRANSSIWGSKSAALESPDVNGLLAFPAFSLAIGIAPSDPPGVVATIILDATGMQPGVQFPISLSIPLAGAFSDWGPAGPAFELVDGLITIIPEPASALLLLGGIPFLRRRR